MIRIDFSNEWLGYTITIDGKPVLDGITGHPSIYRMPIGVVQTIAERLAKWE